MRRCTFVAPAEPDNRDANVTLVGEPAAILVHEVNQPLTAIMINAEIAALRKWARSIGFPISCACRGGECNRYDPDRDTKAAELAYRASIEYARDLGALAWELKAAIPLARSLVEQDRSADALATLKPIYRACPEKTGTRDLAEAEQLLASLR